MNLTQTLLNTYPVLGEKWTMVGMNRFRKAVMSKALGKPNNDWKLLVKQDINPRTNFAEGTTSEFTKASLLSAMSMMFFTGAETVNKSVAFLGGYYRAESRGRKGTAAEKEAMNVTQQITEGRNVMTRTQFHYGSAAKPEMLRNMLLRVPLQFKNFVAQQVSFMFGLRRWEIPRFLLAMFLIAGTLGLPVLWLDRLMYWITGWSPDLAIKELALKGVAAGEMEGAFGTFFAYGLPGVLGIDMTGRVGVGAKFLPLSMRDWKGAWWSTLENAARHGQENAAVIDDLRSMSRQGVDLLRTFTPGLGNPAMVTQALTMEEGWIRSPWQRGRPEYRMTNTEAAMKFFGARPVREAQYQDLRGCQPDAHHASFDPQAARRQRHHPGDRGRRHGSGQRIGDPRGRRGDDHHESDDPECISGIHEAAGGCGLSKVCRRN